MIRFFIFIVLFLSSVGLPVHAQVQPFITATCFPQGEGYYTEMSVYNRLFWYSVDRVVLYTAIVQWQTFPEGWWGTGHSHGAHWYSENSSFRIPPRTRLDGFGWYSEVRPESISFAVVVDPGGWHYTGTLTPTVVPEPSSLLALTGGMGLLAGVLRRRKT